MDQKAFLQNAFVGVVLTATSVSITVETLKELGRLNSKSGTIIVSAALIDDVLGIILLTVITGMSGASVNLLLVIGKILAFFVIAIGAGAVFHILFERYTGQQKEKRRYVLIAFSFCLVLSYVAERFFGVADITGAFIAGVMLSNTKQVHFINRRFDILSYMLISPIFFASVGLSIDELKVDGRMLLVTFSLLATAILTKIIGCGLGARISGCSRKESLEVGTGMATRGEVALIVANKGIVLGIMPHIFMAPIVLMVIVIAIITPIMVKLVFSRQQKLPL